MNTKLRNDAALRQKAVTMPNRLRWDGYSLARPLQNIDPDDLKGFTAFTNVKGEIVFDDNGYRYYFSDSPATL